MKRVPVDSSLLVSIAYSAEQMLLELEFKSGRVYQYDDVPRGVYEELLAADSKGRYFNEVIRDAFPCRAVV